MFWGCFYVPNITGEFSRSGSMYMTSNGCITNRRHTVIPNFGLEGGSYWIESGLGDGVFNLSANLSSDKYGKSNVVQPYSIRYMCLIRT